MADKPIVRRNDVARHGEEVFVLRHHKLRKGYHKAFVQASRRGVWLVYEKIGVRVVGDFRVTHPEGEAPEDYDESYRLAHYASFEHWLETRRPVQMIGDGPLTALGSAGGALRSNYLLDSEGAYFMTGVLVPRRPVHLPALQEDFVEVPDDKDEPGPVRYGAPVPGDETGTLNYWQIKRNSFEDFLALTLDSMLPLLDKMGARVLGVWKLIYPEPARHPDPERYDELLMIVRYASYEHWAATANPARLVGDGPDYQAWREANHQRNELIQDGWSRFLAGNLYGSPPTFIPALEERYRIK